MDLDGERIDVDRAAEDLPAGPGGPLVAADALGQGLPQRPADQIVASLTQFVGTHNNALRRAEDRLERLGGE
jgi:hypothetical protein